MTRRASNPYRTTDMAEATVKSGFLPKESHAPAKAGLLLPRPTAKTGLVSWLTTVDHKKIGILYAGFAIFFFLVGGVEALLIRTQLIVPNNHFLGAHTYG